MTRQDLDKFKAQIRREILKDLTKIINQKLSENVNFLEGIKKAEKSIIFKREDVKSMGRDKALTCAGSIIALAISDMLEKYKTGDFLIEIYRAGDV